MASETGVCNSALIKIGVEPISSFDEDSKAARLCKEQYPKIVDQVLSSHLWNFAMKRVTLALLPDKPAFGFDFAYSIPTDCLRVLHMNNKQARFKIENNKRLLTNLSGASILYVARITDESMFPAYFKEALAYKIAVDLSYALVQNTTLSVRLNDKADTVMRDARSFDGQEGTPDELMSDVWLNARLGDPLGDFLFDDEV